jgi:hypothetical protein
MPLLRTMKAIVATRATIIESLAKDVQRKDEESGGKSSSQLMDWIQSPTALTSY